MKTITICWLLLIIAISSTAQRRDTLDLISSKNVAFENYVLVFSENPNEFFNKNLERLFSEQEINLLSKYGQIDFHILLRLNDNEIIELFTPDNENIDDELLIKIHSLYIKSIETRAHQLVKMDSKEELVYLIFSIDLREFPVNKQG